MQMFLCSINSITKLLYSPEDGTGITNTPLSANDLLDELSKDEPEIIDLDDKSKEKVKGDKEKEIEEIPEKDDEEKDGKERSLEDELEEDLSEEEVDDEKLELALPVSKRAILAKYPNLFKEFPDLEKSYYRERAFSELLPTPADAKEAVEARDTLNSFEADLHNGNTEKILASVKQTDVGAFHKLVDNYLPNLAKVDKDAYHHVVGNVIKSTIISMIQEGRSSQNETLEVAAQILNQFVFATSKFEPITNLSGTDDKVDPRIAEIEKREKAIVEREFERNRDSINKRCENAIRSTLDKNIDPKNSMTDYVKGYAISKAYEELSTLIEKDIRFKSILDQMWKRAFTSNFNQESTDKIKSAYLSKAKALLPAIIKKHRNEALKGLGKKVTEDSEDNTDKKGPLPVGRTRTSTSSSTSGKSGNSEKDKARSIPKDVKSIDYLMQD